MVFVFYQKKEKEKRKKNKKVMLEILKFLLYKCYKLMQHESQKKKNFWNSFIMLLKSIIHIHCN